MAALPTKVEATSTLEPASRFPKTSVPAPEETAHLQDRSHEKEGTL